MEIILCFRRTKTVLKMWLRFMLSWMIIQIVMIIWMSNDRCETLNMILASLLKHCFQVMHIVYSLILYEQVGWAQFLLAKGTFHKYFNTSSKNNKLWQFLYFTFPLISSLRNGPNVCFVQCSTSFISDYIDAILM